MAADGERRSPVRPGTLAETICGVVDAWADEITVLGFPALSAAQRKTLTDPLTLAVQHRVKTVRDGDMESLRQIAHEATARAGFLEGRVGLGQADTLEELQHAYNMIAVLVARLGGAVSVPEDMVYEMMDSQLTVENGEDGQVSLTTTFLAD